MTSLIKVADGEAIKADYRYSYSIVYAVPALGRDKTTK